MGFAMDDDPKLFIFGRFSIIVLLYVQMCVCVRCGFAPHALCSKLPQICAVCVSGGFVGATQGTRPVGSKPLRIATS